jgi:hypothetical protein
MRWRAGDDMARRLRRRVQQHLGERVPDLPSKMRDLGLVDAELARGLGPLPVCEHAGEHLSAPIDEGARPEEALEPASEFSGQVSGDHDVFGRLGHRQIGRVLERDRERLGFRQTAHRDDVVCALPLHDRPDDPPAGEGHERRAGAGIESSRGVDQSHDRCALGVLHVGRLPAHAPACNRDGRGEVFDYELLLRPCHFFGASFVCGGGALSFSASFFSAASFSACSFSDAP